MFTMDPHHVHAVRTAFVRLFEKGLIYRGHRIANWCKDCQTVLSDLEVEYKEVKGQLSYVRYPVIDAEPDTWITVATTRPETILGDTGVAVHPSDPRYKDLIGKHVRIPHVDRVGLIVADDAVDPEFGTGAVKVTPAHDPTDFDISQRTGLPAVNVMNLDGTMNAEAGAYAGKTTAQTRKELLAELDAAGQLVKTEAYTHSVGHCFRSGTVLEPLLLDQWYLRIKPLAEPAIDAVRDGRIKIVPDRFTKVYFNWMENIRDWCISRQLWWGHRIPIYYCDAPGCGKAWAAVEEPIRCPDCNSDAFHQDEDVLDTWFSSGLWPFSTLGWPDETPDLETFYPTSVMETGYDILFFWVARMIMFGLEFTGQVPFHTVYLHGLIKAAGGQKMSKTKGNVKDPLDLIKTYGTDALRLAVTIGNTPGNDFTLTDAILEARQEFVNKLWNVARFVLTNTTPEQRAAALDEPIAGPEAPLVERWIVSRLNRTIGNTTRLMHDYNFGEAGRLVHDFVWDELAAWYLEAYKFLGREQQADAQLLARVFEKVLRLLHPFAPFATEDFWQRLTNARHDRPLALVHADWPTPGAFDPEAEEAWDDLMAVTRATRTLRSDYRIEPRRWVGATIIAPSSERAAFWRAHGTLMGELPETRLRPVEVVEDAGANGLAERSISAVAGGVELLIPAEGLFDVHVELRRTTEELANAHQQVQRLEGSLARPGFANNAPPHVVQAERDRLADQRARLEALERRRTTLERLSQ
jgi:valyl-tRNA synthetase